MINFHCIFSSIKLIFFSGGGGGWGEKKGHWNWIHNMMTFIVWHLFKKHNWTESIMCSTSTLTSLENSWQGMLKHKRWQQVQTSKYDIYQVGLWRGCVHDKLSMHSPRKKRSWTISLPARPSYHHFVLRLFWFHHHCYQLAWVGEEKLYCL